MSEKYNFRLSISIYNSTVPTVGGPCLVSTLITPPSGAPICLLLSVLTEEKSAHFEQSLCLPCLATKPQKTQFQGPRIEGSGKADPAVTWLSRQAPLRGKAMPLISVIFNKSRILHPKLESRSIGVQFHPDLQEYCTCSCCLCQRCWNLTLPTSIRPFSRILS